VEKPKRKRRWKWLVLLSLVGFAFGSYRTLRTDPNVRKIRDLRKELAAGTELTPEQRREKFQQIRETMEKLPPAKRDQIRREIAEEGRQRFESDLRRYARLSPQEKTRYLDQQIDRMEAARRQRSQFQGEAAPPAGSSVVFGSSANVGRPPNYQKGGQPQSAEDREKRRKQRLDETTPEFRALRDQYFKDLQARRQQRGVQVR
jgi:hypothetical protein